VQNSASFWRKILLDKRSQFACVFPRTNKKFVHPYVNVRTGIIHELYWQHPMKYNLEVLLMEYAPSRRGSIRNFVFRLQDYIGF
jgi:hypothetical protein